jgi:HD-like signal output (HDOD) protein
VKINYKPENELNGLRTGVGDRASFDHARIGLPSSRAGVVSKTVERTVSVRPRSTQAGVGGALDVLKARLLTAGREMPVAPRILAEVGRKMQEMEVDLEDLAVLLKLDAGITTVVLRVANTAAYNPHEAFVTLEDALARLGFAKAYRLVGIAALRQLSDQGLSFYGISGSQLRQNALFTALVAELISQAAGACPQGAYTVGLLHSIGKLAINNVTRKVSLEWEGVVDTATERELFGMDNFEAAALLLESWGFPSEIVRGMRDVSDPEPAERLSEVLQLAAGLAERSGYGLPGEFFEWALTPEKMEFLGLTVPAVEEAVKKASKQFLSVRNAVL